MEILSAIISLLGGLAMFLYGIELMGDGLKNSSGATLKRVLEKVTGNVLMGVITGTLVTAVIQSSSATIVLTVALIGAGVLNLKQAVSIVMGANIGTTITAWIVQLGFLESDGSFLLWLFDTATLAPIALTIGIVLLMFVKRKSAKPIADVCLGFGILFIGLDLMNSGIKPLLGTDTFYAFVNILSNPILGILVGLVITFIVKSSSATVSMLQTVASNPAAGITFSMAYPVIMGINLGTCATTALICSIGSGRDAKRTGVVHIVFNTIGTVVFMIVMTIMERMDVFGAEFWLSGVDATGIAMFQTVFNLLTTIVLLPFTNQLVALSKAVVKDEPEKPARHPELTGLSDNLMISPAMALGEATKAVVYMAQLAKANFLKGCQQLTAYDADVYEEMSLDEECLDQFTDDTDRFLISLSKEVENEAEDRQLDMLMQAVPNFERVGDYAIDLVKLRKRLNDEDGKFSESALKELSIISSAVEEILTLTIEAFTENDDDKATSIEPLEEVIDDMVRILRDRHTKRLKNGQCTVTSGLIFMEALTYLERCSDQCSSTALLLLARHNEAILTNHYDYVRHLHEGTDKHYAAELRRRRAQYVDQLYHV